MINFKVDGKVVAKQSAKYANMGSFIKAYTPDEMVNYSNWVKMSFRMAYPAHLPSAFFEKALAVKISVFAEVPKSYSKIKRAKALCGQIRPTVKPDCDNIAKNILDSLNGLVYPDDKQIVTLLVVKKYAEVAYVEISVQAVEV